MDIVVCTDKKFVRFDGVLFKSICINNKSEDICFHVVVDESVTSIDKNSLENIVKQYDNKKIFFYLMDDNVMNTFPNIRDNSTITKATYYRLAFTKILPENIEKVLYLDGDIIIRKNIAKMFDTDIRDCAIGCIVDMDEDDDERYVRLGYDKALGYFNAGVLLINLKFWRDNNVFDKFMKVIEQIPDKLQCHDQDVMNIVFKECKKNLPLTYNFQNGFLYQHLGLNESKYAEEIKNTLSDPAIVHYTCTKPWVKDCGHPWKNLYFKYEAMTQWYNAGLLPSNKKKHSFWKRMMLYIHIHHNHDKKYIELSSID